MLGPVLEPSLDRVLRGVSRSIYLTLKVAPASTRRQLGLAYLFCRAADTIADTRLCSPEDRRRLLLLFREQFEAGSASTGAAEQIARELGPPQAIAEERELLARLGDCFAAQARLEPGDRDLVRALLMTLTRGMVTDLERFPPEESGRLAALETDEELDLYTYHVAGCVGEFWTKLHVAHLAALRDWSLDAMCARAVLFGKGLQMTNILRDVHADLAIGRCYLPRRRLEAAGLAPEDLRRGVEPAKLRPLLDSYLRQTLALYRSGWEYTLAVPRSAPRLRLACAWPLLIGLRTLALLSASPDPYAPGSHHKASRPEVYRILRRSTLAVFSERRLRRLYDELEAGVSVEPREAPAPASGPLP